MRILFTAAFLLCLVQISVAQLARVQFIHNAPGDNIDIYIDGNLYVNNLVFRTATPYVDIPLGSVQIQVASANSTSSADAITTISTKLENDQAYVIMVGLLEKGRPDYEIAITNQVSEYADTGNTVGISFVNGSPNTGELDFFWKEFSFSLFDDIAYGDFSPMLSLPTGQYDIDITSAFDNEEIFTSHSFDFHWWRGRSLVLFTSGFEDSEPYLKTYVCLSTGGTFALEDLAVEEEVLTAFAQVIHNAAKENVDIYIDTKKVEDNLVYRTATPFLELMAKQEITIGVAPKNSTSAEDVYKKVTVTLEVEDNYVIILNGDITGNPDDIEINIFDQGQQQASGNSKVSLLFCNGATGGTETDFAADEVVVHNNVLTGGFTSYIDFEPTTYRFELKDNENLIAAYEAHFDFWKGGAAVVYTSGRYNDASMPLKMYVALPTGGTFPLSELEDFGGSELEGRSEEIAMTETLRVETHGNVVNEQVTTFLHMQERAPVRATIYNSAGLPIKQINFGRHDKGTNRMTINTQDLSSGAYVIHWMVGRAVHSERVIVAWH